MDDSSYYSDRMWFMKRSSRSTSEAAAKVHALIHMRGSLDAQAVADEHWMLMRLTLSHS